MAVGTSAWKRVTYGGRKQIIYDFPTRMASKEPSPNGDAVICDLLPELRAEGLHGKPPDFPRQERCGANNNEMLSQSQVFFLIKGILPFSGERPKPHADAGTQHHTDDHGMNDVSHARQWCHDATKKKMERRLIHVSEVFDVQNPRLPREQEPGGVRAHGALFAWPPAWAKFSP